LHQTQAAQQVREPEQKAHRDQAAGEEEQYDDYGIGDRILHRVARQATRRATRPPARGGFDYLHSSSSDCQLLEAEDWVLKSGSNQAPRVKASKAKPTTPTATPHSVRLGA